MRLTQYFVLQVISHSFSRFWTSGCGVLCGRLLPPVSVPSCGRVHSGVSDFCDLSQLPIFKPPKLVGSVVNTHHSGKTIWVVSGTRSIQFSCFCSCHQGFLCVRMIMDLVVQTFFFVSGCSSSIVTVLSTTRRFGGTVIRQLHSMTKMSLCTIGILRLSITLFVMTITSFEVTQWTQ